MGLSNEERDAVVMVLPLVEGAKEFIKTIEDVIFANH